MTGAVNPKPWALPELSAWAARRTCGRKNFKKKTWRRQGFHYTSDTSHSSFAFIGAVSSLQDVRQAPWANDANAFWQDLESNTYEWTWSHGSCTFWLLDSFKPILFSIWTLTFTYYIMTIYTSIVWRTCCMPLESLIYSGCCTHCRIIVAGSALNSRGQSSSLTTPSGSGSQLWQQSCLVGSEKVLVRSSSAPYRWGFWQKVHASSGSILHFAQVLPCKISFILRSRNSAFKISGIANFSSLDSRDVPNSAIQGPITKH